MRKTLWDLGCSQQYEVISNLTAAFGQVVFVPVSIWKIEIITEAQQD